ncbi:unnamed protein product [Blepharisma stoltei]|uniref:Uncharacterized protein n=1 Tax=Blepharisma stoltei TaxID=1481888 RepID=A0AAU9J491_9CILI|nr:unnamed protein product [Blepharisma stoltei]
MASKRLKWLEGSLRKPHFQYVMSANITHYPYNNDYGKHFLKKFTELCVKYDSKKVQETFVWKKEIIGHRDLAKVHTCTMEFIDGSKDEFDYSHVKWEHFMMWLKDKNEYLEGKRNLEGFDDEPDDEIN